MSYSIPTEDQAPQDSAGSRLVLALTGGAAPDTHYVSVHGQAINTAPAISGSTIDYTYTGITPGPLGLLGIAWAGTELGVNDTFTALANVLAPAYDDTWSITLARVYSVDSRGVSFQLFPTANPDAVPGSSSTAHVTATGVARITASIYTGRSWGGGRTRTVLPCFNARAPQVRVKDVTGSSGGIDTALDHALIGYLTGTDTRLLAHNGGKLLSPFVIHVTAMARLRRVYSNPNG